MQIHRERFRNWGFAEGRGFESSVPAEKVALVRAGKEIMTTERCEIMGVMGFLLGRHTKEKGQTRKSGAAVIALHR